MPAATIPPLHTPLAGLPALVLDLETTGLDVTRDRIVQIGALAMQGAHLLDEPRLNQRVAPRIPIPAQASAIHGLHDDDVAGAPAFAELVPGLQELLAGRIVIGHHVGFDLAVLRHEAARAGIEWRDPPALDVAMLLGALEPALPDLDLETVAAHLGVEVAGRHDAMGDCMSTARSFARLLPRLRQAEVRTLGEAWSFMARRDDLVLQQARAGWDTPAGAQAPQPAPGPRLDAFVFERRLHELMSSPPVYIDAGASLAEAARAMVEQRIGALLVGAPGAPAEGILTERDLLRAAAADASALERTPVAARMSTPVVCLGDDEMLYRALARMDRLNMRHLCITDHDGVAVGIVSQRDLLHDRARAAAALDDAVAVAGNAAELARAYGGVADVAAGLVSEGSGGRDVARVVSAELRALIARAGELAAARMQSEGFGAAPAAWCLLVLGSGGRGESLLVADQDNALIHQGSSGDDAWFAPLGEHVAELLDTAGVPRCKGGVMAANQQWRGSDAQWRERVDTWLRRARPEDLLNVDIFFDLEPVGGDTRLGRTLHREAVAAAQRSAPFIGLLAASVQSLAPRFGWLRRLPSQDGRIDLKRDGLLPLVSLARVLALCIGSTARNTPDRLDEAAEAGRLPAGDARALVELHGHLLDAVLAQQLADLAQGIPPGSRVVERAIERDRHDRILDGLRRLAQVLQELRGAVAR